MANASPSLPMTVLPGNGIPPRRDRWPKIGSGREKVSAETVPPTSKPANCGPLASLREVFRFERLRGGLGRTRTSNQRLGRHSPAVRLPTAPYPAQARGHRYEPQEAPPAVPRGTAAPFDRTAHSVICRQPPTPKSPLLECNGTGRFRYVGAPRPVPLRHRAIKAQLKLGLYSSADEAWGSGHSLSHSKK